VSPVVAQVLGEKVKNATIPDISGNAETPIGNVFYSLSRYVHEDLGLGNSYTQIFVIQNNNKKLPYSGYWVSGFI